MYYEVTFKYAEVGGLFGKMTGISVCAISFLPVQLNPHPGKTRIIFSLASNKPPIYLKLFRCKFVLSKHPAPYAMFYIHIVRLLFKIKILAMFSLVATHTRCRSDIGAHNTYYLQLGTDADTVVRQILSYYFKELEWRVGLAHA